MIPRPHIFPTEPAKPPARQSTAVEALVGLAQVAIAVAAWLQLQTPRAWWILGLGLAWLGVAFGRPVARAIRDAGSRRHDDQVARRALPQLRALTKMFGKLVSPNAIDTLQAGLQEAFKDYHGVLDRLHVPPAHLFDELLNNLNARLDSEPADLGHLRRGLEEFRTIISAYSTQCIEPVFRNMPKDVREMVKPANRAALNSFRERYVHFVTGYTEFTEELAESLQSARYYAPHVFRPDEMTA